MLPAQSHLELNLGGLEAIPEDEEDSSMSVLTVDPTVLYYSAIKNSSEISQNGTGSQYTSKDLTCSKQCSQYSDFDKISISASLMDEPINSKIRAAPYKTNFMVEARSSLKRFKHINGSSCSSY